MKTEEEIRDYLAYRQRCLKEIQDRIDSAKGFEEASAWSTIAEFCEQEIGCLKWVLNEV